MLMSPEESLQLLLRRWDSTVDVVRSYGGTPGDIWRAGLILGVRIYAERRDAAGNPVRDPYVFRLDFADYDDHAARVQLCDPSDPTRVGEGKEFYPLIDGNSVFSHEAFFCMPGDRRCYEHGTGQHKEWMEKHHYHPDIVIGSLFEILRSPGYRERS
jgi:hypothetical protein